MIVEAGDQEVHDAARPARSGQKGAQGIKESG